MPRKLVFSLAAVISMTASFPASAASVTARMLVEEMKKHGVRTVQKPICTKEEFHATYNRATNEFCITTPLFYGNQRLLLEVVTHEAVHVIQDCIAGGLRSTSSSTITDYVVSSGLRTREEAADMFTRRIDEAGIGEHVRRVVKGSRNKHHAVAEIEAYALQNQPQKVYALLQKSCG